MLNLTPTPRWIRVAYGAAVSLLLVTHAAAATFTPVPQAFVQEIAHHFDHTNGLPGGPIQLVEVSVSGQPRVFANARWWTFAENRWTALSGVRASEEREFHFPIGESGSQRVAIPWREVIQLIRFGSTNYVVTATDPFQVLDGNLTSLNWPSRFTVRQLAVSPAGELWLASTAGLHRRTDQGWSAVRVADGLGRVWGAEDVRGVAFDAQGRVWFATLAGVAVRDSETWKFYDGTDGLPWNDFTGVTAGRDGAVWFGTRLGAIRFDGTEWHYRQGTRWLPDNQVTQVAVNARGDAWLATPSGLGWIERRPMTLADKAKFYEAEIDQYIRRTPYQYIAQAHLRRPGDRTSAATDDDDNDGLWTAMYGAGECFAWAATRDPEAKSRARRAFEALRFLQEVTRGSQPAPPPGYVARTIRSSDLPDPNVGRIEGDREARAKQDSLWKVYEPRWPKSADGAWYWKSDTSSDELDGHYFLYAQYFELCAESPEEKARVREVVRALTDHLLANHYALVDVDGTPTRWAQFGPKTLNLDPQWWWERGLNSLSMLSYLAVTEHITGDAKYGQAARELIDVHGYAQNAMVPKIQAGIGSGNQSDDEMAFMCFYNLLRYSKDERLRTQLRLAFHNLWLLEQPEMNPFFNFAYAAVGLGESITTQWGRAELSPWAGWLEDSGATLRGMPLDRISRSAKNSHRLDVLRLPRQNSIDLTEPDRRARGWRVNQKVVPVENRDFHHWNTDPWTLDYGGGGGTLGSGTVFLLPYYMGLFHGYIEKPN